MSFALVNLRKKNTYATYYIQYTRSEVVDFFGTECQLSAPVTTAYAGAHQACTVGQEHPVPIAHAQSLAWLGPAQL